MSWRGLSWDKMKSWDSRSQPLGGWSMFFPLFLFVIIISSSTHLRLLMHLIRLVTRIPTIPGGMGGAFVLDVRRYLPQGMILRQCLVSGWVLKSIYIPCFVSHRSEVLLIIWCAWPPWCYEYQWFYSFFQCTTCLHTYHIPHIKQAYTYISMEFSGGQLRSLVSTFGCLCLSGGVLAADRLDRSDLATLYR